MINCIFSEDKAYRYLLTRRFNEKSEAEKRFVNFIMLNPSTADEVNNDPTIERCCQRAKRWGYDGLHVTNLFAYRSTEPANLKLINDPVGPENDYHIRSIAKDSELVICGWGSSAKVKKLIDKRAEIVKRWFWFDEINTHYLKISEASGHPWHPLYLSYELSPQKWDLWQSESVYQ